MTKHYIFTNICILVIALFSFIAGCNHAITNQLKSKCPYEGAECPNAQLVMQDYQLQYYMDTLWIYSGDRLVGTNIDSIHGDGYIHGSFIDSLIMADNL